MSAIHQGVRSRGWLRALRCLCGRLSAEAAFPLNAQGVEAGRARGVLAESSAGSQVAPPAGPPRRVAVEGVGVRLQHGHERPCRPRQRRPLGDGAPGHVVAAEAPGPHQGQQLGGREGAQIVKLGAGVVLPGLL